MSTAPLMEARYWLTEAGCSAAGGHRVHADGACSTCAVCGAELGGGE